jgi:glycerophosphoryl diester phosphodiesterase
MRTLVLAHRGAHTDTAGGVAENSIEAFTAARHLGADGVELDVRRTRDGVLVLHHDAEIPRRGRVGDMAATDLPPEVALLGDALAACAGMVVDVEVKYDPAGDPDRRLAAAVGEMLAGARPMQASAPGAEGRSSGVLVSSFDGASLDVVRQRAPAVPTGLLVAWTADPWRALDEAVRHGCQAVHPFVTQVDAALVAAAHRLGMAVNVWTVNADADLVAMARLGVDAVITDRVPAALLAVGGRPRNGDGGAESSTMQP